MLAKHCRQLGFWFLSLSACCGHVVQGQVNPAQGTDSMSVPSTLAPTNAPQRDVSAPPPAVQANPLMNANMQPEAPLSTPANAPPASPAVTAGVVPMPTAPSTPTAGIAGAPQQSAPVASPQIAGAASGSFNNNPGRPPVIPSLEADESSARSLAPKAMGDYQLPRTAGQQWVEYDIRPFTRNVKNVEKPQQWIVDWILRETGTDVWFNEPMGVLSVDSEKLRVFHTPSMQKRVAEIYEKFVNGVSEPQVYGLRIITVSNPQWRSKAFPLMKPVPSKSPGVSAWLMPKENGAMLLAQLRERSDAKELQAVEIPLYNGQLQYLEQLRSRSYLKDYAQDSTNPYYPYQPVTEQIQEGFKLQISPLMNLDGRTADLLLKCEIDQVERLNQVKLDLPVGFNQFQSAQVEVPQVVSWRLQERFQWPTDQVLLLSCGVVANPVGAVDNTFLRNPPTILGLNRVLPAMGQRNDAILWIEYKGTASNHLGMNPTQASAAATVGGAIGIANSGAPSAGIQGQNSQQAVSPVSRGRY